LLKTNAGWVAPEYHLMGWALSCLQLSKYYNNVTLYADTVSARLLIDTLQLPYSNIVCNLGELNTYHSGLWALPKIYTYSQQLAPFLHVDGDVFIWKPFEESLLAGDIIAQNKEAGTHYYENILISLERNLSYFPEEIKEQRNIASSIYAFNTGIFGGSDIPFFKEYTSKAFEFVNNNVEYFSKIHVADFNIFFEQYLLFCLTEKYNKNVSLLFDNVIEDLGYTGFGEFADVPHRKQYLHLIGTYKRNVTVCNQMANRLRQDYPSYYYRIIQLFRNNKLPLKRDYYHSLNVQSENVLVKRFNFLKENHITKGSYARVEEKELSFWRTNMINRYFTQVNNNAIPESTVKNLIKDVFKVENDIQSVLTSKFSHLNEVFLYQRDILSNCYTERVFADTNKIDDVQLMSGKDYEIIDSHYDWTLLDDRESSLVIIVQKILESCQEMGSIIMIPECHKEGYSLVHVDDLDMYILELLKKPLSIKLLFEELAKEFDNEELNNSYEEFKLLIFGRIKTGLVNKLIVPLQ